MLPLRHASTRPVSTRRYICLSCQLQSTQLSSSAIDQQSYQRDPLGEARTVAPAGFDHSQIAADSHLLVARARGQGSSSIQDAPTVARRREGVVECNKVDRAISKDTRPRGGIVPYRPIALVDGTKKYIQRDIKTTPPKSTRSYSQYAPVSFARSEMRRVVQSKQPTFQLRRLHTCRPSSQHAAPSPLQSDYATPPPPHNLYGSPNSVPDIRTRLRQWQETHGNPEEDSKVESVFEQDPDSMDGTYNTLTRLPDMNNATKEAGDVEDEYEAATYYSHDASEDQDSITLDERALRMGDLVELPQGGASAEMESMVAIYVRKLRNNEGQFFGMNGRWLSAKERRVPYSIPGWISPEMVEPLLEHLPKPLTGEDTQRLRELAVREDISVPRSVSGPLISKMTQFQAESHEIYRQHASALDDAHNILAHDTDLRYGSLTSAATTLLQMPADKLPVTALYTVRNSLSKRGFAFAFDDRSHRLTGYLQIRPKDQVEMVHKVQNWIRDWQDDKAKRIALQASPQGQRALRKHKTPATAQHIYGFIEKARGIILESRKDREPTSSGTIGPSRKRFPITPDSESVRVKTDLQFTIQESEIVRFFEAWSCSLLFHHVPAFKAQCSSILQAIGLYSGLTLNNTTGFIFLQELGTIMPYDNRTRFDPHLLLPSSQHSRPLQSLMSSVMQMHKQHNFVDSMKDLRHDWGDMSVYCIDDASAHEIDDGFSIERAGKDEWWVHVHIANPTAFFERDHPLAKMARHMGESIYMPERSYMMLPRWATSKYFSLGSNRPCLTFSAKLNSEGAILDQKIRPGVARNVLSLTTDEAAKLVGAEVEGNEPQLYTVGGEPPPQKTRKSIAGDMTEQQVGELKTLLDLSVKRQEIRRGQGGFVLNKTPPSIELWQNTKGPGLPWDHPHRRGSRSVEGDPIIRLRTAGHKNWFVPTEDPINQCVQEMMLLAGEVASGWCMEREIPTIYRGTVNRPDMMNPEKYLKEVIEPAAKQQPNGEWPEHLGLDYLHLRGTSTMTSSPLKHKMLGLDCYSKVTSPLRRYGDMICHWQIEAAIREEARQGKSLVTDDKSADRSFLPFSRPVLETIMVGLNPREQMISQTKQRAISHWLQMFAFRAYQYGECEMPFATPFDPSKPYMRYLVDSTPSSGDILGFDLDLDSQVRMFRPEEFGLGTAVRGDVWEVEIDHVNIYYRATKARPIRLVHRSATPSQLLR